MLKPFLFYTFIIFFPTDVYTVIQWRAGPTTYGARDDYRLNSDSYSARSAVTLYRRRYLTAVASTLTTNDKSVDGRLQECRVAAVCKPLLISQIALSDGHENR